MDEDAAVRARIARELEIFFESLIKTDAREEPDPPSRTVFDLLTGGSNEPA